MLHLCPLLGEEFGINLDLFWRNNVPIGTSIMQKPKVLHQKIDCFKSLVVRVEILGWISSYARRSSWMIPISIVQNLKVTKARRYILNPHHHHCNTFPMLSGLATWIQGWLHEFCLSVQHGLSPRIHVKKCEKFLQLVFTCRTATLLARRYVLNKVILWC